MQRVPHCWPVTITPTGHSQRSPLGFFHFFPPIFVSPVTLKWNSGWSCSFEWRKRMWWRVISEPGLFAHIATPFYRNVLLPGLVSPPVCLSVRAPWWYETKPLNRITQVRRSRKPSLQRGCVEEAFMWLPSLGLQRPTQFGVASLNFITMRFYSVVVRVYV